MEHQYFWWHFCITVLSARGINISYTTFLDAEGNVFEIRNSLIASENIAIKVFVSDIERISKLATCFAFRTCI